MRLADLTDEELLAMVGLAKLVVRADKELSNDEAGALRALAVDVGDERWQQALGEATRRFRTRSDAMFYAKNVNRAEARALIHQQMVKLSESDQVVAEEQKVLDWLAELWELKG
jgi:hypothetical protein